MVIMVYGMLQMNIVCASSTHQAFSTRLKYLNMFVTVVPICVLSDMPKIRT